MMKCWRSMKRCGRSPNSTIARARWWRCTSSAASAWRRLQRPSTFRSRRFTATGDWPDRGCCACCAEESWMKPERWEQIERLYYAALELEPDARGTFIDQACAGDEELRRKVISLLNYDDSPAGFIQSPLLEVAVSELADQPLSGAQTQPLASPPQISGYRLLSPLGRGGMGEVHLALDKRLNRKVAIKLLPVDFTSDAGRVRRFEQEARAASALNHPNIITIHEIGETESTHYIVTEYVEGDTLRQRMSEAPQQRMKLSEAIETAAQVAAALTAAHEAGITHRDIKPENVMARRDGIVKVLDFGLAKLTETQAAPVDSQSPTVEKLSTEDGVVMGTPRYMSPEQARGEKVDSRTDIFSLGVMLYEMVTGRAPFAGATTSEVIAAILRDSPPPLAEYAPEAPGALELIVNKALRKDRAERYQSANDLLADLKELKQRIDLGTRLGEAPFGAPPSGGSGAFRLPARPINEPLPPEGGAPRTRRRQSMIIAVVAFAIAAIAGLVMWTYFHRQPALIEKDTVLLADFENKTGEDIFDGSLEQALAIQLQQSPFLNLYPEPRLRQALQQMNRPPNTRVTAEVAREVCERQNLKALIAGAIASFGSRYAITLEAVNGQTGETLARVQVEAFSKEQTLTALAQAATQLRARLGETLGSIELFNKPVAQATTSKLEAYKAWSAGLENSYNGRPAEAIPFYKRAVDLDPEFANAYSVLSTVYWTTGQMELAAEAAEKGYAIKDRANEFEQLHITNFYHGFSTGNLDKRIEVLLLQKQLYPREQSGPTNLALTYNMLGRYDEAVAEAREALRLYPTFAPANRALGWPLLHLNRYAEAREFLTQMLQQNIAHPDSRTILYQLAFIDDDQAGMQKQLDWARGKPYEYIALDWQAGAAAFAGQWRRAQTLARQAIDQSARGDTQEIAARYAGEQALRGAALGACRQARQDAARGLKLTRGRVSLPRAALALAMCGEANQARSLIVELTTRYPEDTIINSIWLPAIRAAIDLQRGNAAQAIDQLQAASRYEAAAEFWPQHMRGHAYLKLGRGAEAAAEFQKILDHRGYAPLSPLYPLAHLGLARAAKLMGDTAKSRKAWDDFFAAWKDADADLPILREAVKERSHSLLGAAPMK